MRQTLWITASLLFAATPAAAFPDKPIVINVCQPAGGGNDRSAQSFVPFAEKHFGRPIIVQYRPGAGGTLAMQEIKSAAPDGHTLVLCDPGGTIFGPIVQNSKFAPSDVVPIARTAFIPWVLTVHSKTPYKTVNDLVIEAKKQPGQLRGAVADIASADHYTWLLFTKATGLGPTGFRWIPYGGGGPKLRAMLAGESEIDMMLYPLIRDAIQKGIVRTLAVAASQRLKEMPDTPTFKELGHDIVDGLSIAIFAPAGTPPDRVARLRAGFMAIRNDPAYQEAYGKQGQDIASFISGSAYQADWDRTWSEARTLLKAVTTK